jgi:hypothetical protein
MPREELEALAADVRRLLDAGGAAASGDGRLLRRAAALRSLARQVPALEAIATAAEGTASVPPARATAALLDLLLVARHARAGLAAPSAAGDAVPVPDAGPWATPAHVRNLAFCAACLRRAALDDGERAALAVADLRLLDAVVVALREASDDVADLLAERTLPAFGPAVTAELRRGLEHEPPLAAARRLIALCRLDPDAARDALRALDPEAASRVGRTAPALT